MRPLPFIALLSLMLLACPRSRADGAAKPGDGPGGGASSRAPDPGAGAEAELRRANADWVRSFTTCDVARYRTLLATEFSGVRADGRTIDRADFLLEAARPPDARNLRLADLTVRLYGPCGLVSATVRYERHTGLPVATRYSALYVWREGRWQVVHVQWTRVLAP